MERYRPPDESELPALFEEVKNWGRWGDDDGAGTLNTITARHRVKAASLVRSGAVVSLAHDLDTQQSAKNYFPTVHMMLLKDYEGAVTAVDQVTIVPHSFTVTHLDAVSHSNFGGVLYNGRHARDVVKRTGLSAGSILELGNGVFTRGVLLDIAASRGVPWLQPTEYVTSRDLDRAAEWAGVDVADGDVVIVRVGIGARERDVDDDDIGQRAGLSPETVRWFRQHDVAIYGGDCFERLPLPYERYPWAFHQIAQAAVGLVLLDNVEVEELADTCRAHGRWEFLFTTGPLRLPGGTGSAVNPLAVF